MTKWATWLCAIVLAAPMLAMLGASQYSVADTPRSYAAGGTALGFSLPAFERSGSWTS